MQQPWNTPKLLNLFLAPSMLCWLTHRIEQKQLLILSFLHIFVVLRDRTLMTSVIIWLLLKCEMSQQSTPVWPNKKKKKRAGSSFSWKIKGSTKLSINFSSNAITSSHLSCFVILVVVVVTKFFFFFFTQTYQIWQGFDLTLADSKTSLFCHTKSCNPSKSF